MAAQAQRNNDALITDIHQYVDGFLKRNPNSWQGHQLKRRPRYAFHLELYRGADLAGAKELGTAIGEYRAALAAKPDDPVITLSLGRTLVVDGETAEAESLFRHLIAKDKTNIASYYELYRVYISLRRIPDAEAVLKEAIANNPKDTQLRLTLAQYYYGTNKRAELVALLNQMKGDLKQFPDAYFQSGDFYLRVGSFDEAVKQYDEGIQKDLARQIPTLNTRSRRTCAGANRRSLARKTS